VCTCASPRWSRKDNQETEDALATMSQSKTLPVSRLSHSGKAAREGTDFDEELGTKRKISQYIIDVDMSPEQEQVEAKVLRKVDYRLIPILGLLYSVAGLDRVNLSNARIAGMNKDLRFDIGDRYSIALLVFFITYCIFEMPTTLLLRPVGPKNLLNGLAISWGVVMLGMGWVDDWRLIVVCRMLIGVLEAGFLPCCMLLLSTWYQRYEIQQRMSWWYLINLFVSAFGNILAWAIVKLHGVHGKSIPHSFDSRLVLTALLPLDRNCWMEMDIHVCPHKTASNAPLTSL
jgi:hypothetical protein